MEISLKRQENFKFEFDNGQGKKAVLDGPTSIGGGDDGIRPMQMVLGALAGCSSFDVSNILNKGRQKAERFEVRVTGKRRDEEPKVFTEIHAHFDVDGQVEEKQLKRALDLSFGKYCSVSAMLEKTAKITYDY